MPNFLLELFSEEIPARMQAKAEADLLKAVEAGLKAQGLSGADAQSFSGPRRLTVALSNVPERSADVSDERKGPKVGAPEKAVAGFLRGAGLDSIDQAEIRTDPKKGAYYVAVKQIPGRPADEIIAALIPEIVSKFHWPKSMRTGRGELRWVRPLQGIVCLLDDQIVAFEIDGLHSGNQTEGHRVHGRGPYTLTGLEDYRSQLEGPGHVRLSRADRRDTIAQQAEAVCREAGLELIEDAGLLEEVVGLAEWPSVVLGDMDPAFLELPPEVIQLSMRTHQKYFAVRDPETGKLAPHFVVVANLTAKDGGKAIAAGNRKVLSARLEDGRFFYQNDKKTGLEAMAPKLATIAFKEGLGTLADKVERVANLAQHVARAIGTDPELAARAARLAKADLTSEMVYEFPELQGVMGRYYALDAGEDARIADAIRDHYKPQGPSDRIPTEPASVALALADKLDTLVGFWAIDEKPTGSKDPFALRRAALGVVRISLENSLGLSFEDLLSAHWQAYFSAQATVQDVGVRSLSEFLEGRLSVALKDAGGRYDLVAAALAAESHLDGGVVYTRTVKRVEALADFLDNEDGVNLLSGYKRAANILKAEEKKSNAAFDGDVDAEQLQVKGEIDLHAALTQAEAAAHHAIQSEDFGAAMTALAGLRAPVDAFFEGEHSVMVNAEEAALRENRLRLLNRMRMAIHTVADFSQIEA